VATDYSNRINRVNARRNNSGGTRLSESLSFAQDSSRWDTVVKNYGDKTNSKSFQYALVSMQEVDAKYTQISYREAERVASQIDSGLSKLGKTVTVELQGSLPLNVHLRRVSDVDMLVWPESFFMFSPNGVAASGYVSSSSNAVAEITSLRTQCVSVIQNAFPATKVDDTGAKCITVTDGSLLRDIDVVPSVLFKTAEYQLTQNDANRGVQIYDKKAKEILVNYPFKVRALINAKDSNTAGGCKKAIRLLKNMKEDADTTIALSSFNIMSLVYAMTDASLVHQFYSQGKIVSSLQEWFYELAHDEAKLRSLYTVDGSRKIVQSAADVTAVSQMSDELSMLLCRIALELQPSLPSNYPAWRSKIENEVVF
jgi:hypothetical protein